MEHAAPRAPWRRPQVTLPLAYLAFASAWLLLLDEALGAWSGGRAGALLFAKDLGFVIATTVLLAVGLGRSFERSRQESERRVRAELDHADALRRLAGRLRIAREEEQLRLARDLHDDLAQLVTGLALTLRAAAVQAAALPPGERAAALVEALATATGLIGQLQGSIRRLATGLRPPLLDVAGLPGALSQELRGLESRAGVATVLRTDPDLPTLPEPVAVALYRICREALTNVARHAEARHVEVTLRHVDGAAALLVEDDGRGLGPVAPGSLGLLGMRERAAALGGEVLVHTRPQGGTAVSARIPLRAAAGGIAA